jgi:phage gpG-like protein
VSVGLQIGTDELERLQRRLLKAARVDFVKLLAGLGALVENQSRNRIQNTKRGPDGGLWDPWSDKYAASKHGAANHQPHPGEHFESQGHSLLSLSGALLDSIHWRTTFDELEVGSNLVYAGRQNKTRTFLGLSKDDTKEAVVVIEEFLDKNLGLA